jgi:hypothetical protein
MKPMALLPLAAPYVPLLAAIGLRHPTTNTDWTESQRVPMAAAAESLVVCALSGDLAREAPDALIRAQRMVNATRRDSPAWPSLPHGLGSPSGADAVLLDLSTPTAPVAIDLTLPALWGCEWLADALEHAKARPAHTASPASLRAAFEALDRLTDACMRRLDSLVSGIAPPPLEAVCGTVLRDFAAALAPVFWLQLEFPRRLEPGEMPPATGPRRPFAAFAGGVA